jgi:hypothetical protein
MKNLKTYEEFLNESIPSYSFDGNQIEVGSSVQSLDGFSGIIISKEISNGKVSFRDNKGIIHICESKDLIIDDLNEGLKWWDIAKGIVASDAIKTGPNFKNGSILSTLISLAWRDKITNKIESIRNKPGYDEMKDVAFTLADKLSNDPRMYGLVNKLASHPRITTIFTPSQKEKIKAAKVNLERQQIIKDISSYINDSLTPEEKKFFDDINNLIKIKNPESEEIEEDVTTDPNRTVGTGTYTTTHSDPNVLTKGYSNTTDSGSNGSYPVYIG